jgi:hypothetical protein
MPLRQRQGARRRLEPARPRADPPRADLHAAHRSRREVSGAAGPAPASACPTRRTVQKAARREEGRRSEFPIILTSGRLVEYEGGGEETRSNKWLAELQQDMFVEINPADAAARGIRDGQWVWVPAPRTTAGKRVKALVTERVGAASPSCRSTSPAGSGRGPARALSARHRSDRARRVGERRHDLRLRPGDQHAGDQGHALPDPRGVNGRKQWPA